MNPVDQDILDVLHGVVVYQHGVQITGHGAVLLCVSQHFDGTLPDEGYSFEWRVSEASAQRVFTAYKERVAELGKGPSPDA